MCWWQSLLSHTVVYNTPCETKYCGNFFSLFEHCIPVYFFFFFAVLGAASLETQSHAPKRSWIHMDYLPFCDTVPCSTTTQPLSALVQTCSLTGKVCSCGKVMEMGGTSEGAAIGTSLHPARDISHSRAQVHASTHRAAGQWIHASSEKCQGKAEAARQQCYEQCLIPALRGLLLS